MGAGLMRRRNSEGHRALIGAEGNGARLGIVCACATAFAFHFRVAAATSASSWALQSLRRFRAPGPFPVPGPRCAPAARTPYRLFPPPVPTSRRPTPPRHRSGFGGRAGPGGAAAAAAAAAAGGRAARRMWYIMQSVQSKYSLSERLIRTIAAIRSFPRDNVEDLIGRVSDGGPEPSPLIKGRRKGAVARPHVGLQLLAGGRALSSAL